MRGLDRGGGGPHLGELGAELLGLDLGDDGPALGCDEGLDDVAEVARGKPRLATGYRPALPRLCGR